MSGDGPGKPTPMASRVAEFALTEFKTLTSASGRKGVRLEKVFWDALTEIGTATGQKRSQLVGELIEQAQAQDINASSAIRGATVDFLLNDLRRLKPLTSTANMLRLLQAGPAPSFALDRRKRLVQANAEFLRYLRTVVGSAPGVAADGAQLSLERPIEVLFDELASGETSECGVSIRVGNRERRSMARFLLVPPEPASILIGYLLS